ncbi:MAG: histidine phosphatase family protein [Ruminococcaceae bacterium]|nr:histidine phosphatase family protein [Oscillospiraceae bacterium]
MQTLIYMIRHGESVGNQKRDFLGHTDLPITEKGEKQALSAAKHLASIGFAPDAVYASPLCRAHKTTLLALSLCDAPAPTLLDGLREIYAGEWEGKNFDALDEEYPEERRLWREDVGHACPVGGESVAELYGRVVSTVLTIAKENEGKTVFIGTHATPIRAVETYARGKSADLMCEVPWPSNASLSVYRFDGERLFPICYSFDEFMKDAVDVDHALKY